MSDETVSISEALRIAIDRHRAGGLLDAEHIYQKVLEIEPDEPNALHFLGVLCHQLGRHDDAIRLIRRSLEIDPSNSAAHQNLGNVLCVMGRRDEAAAAYGRANPPGVMRPATAEQLEAGYRIDLVDTLIGLRKAGRTDEAIAVVRAWIEHDPHHAGAQHLLAALTGRNVPPRAPDNHLREMFDSFADSFDAKLSSLDYQAPELLRRALLPDLAEQGNADDHHLDVLDAGCGTGLCGRWLKTIAGRLVGVDISAKMIDKARRLGVYDELHTAELTGWLAAHPAEFDVVVASDTINYFGDLTPIFAAAARAVRTGGRFAFTVEAADDPQLGGGFRLEAHGRYAHTIDYVSRSLQSAGFALLQFDQAVLRKELNEPVCGFVVVALRK